jgi:hypothetical protein
MYITVAWSAIPPTDPIDAEADIFAALSGLAFDKIYNAHDNVMLAAIRKGNGREQMQLLDTELRKTCVGRFSYIVTVTPTDWDLVNAPDVDYNDLKPIIKYKT